MVQTELSRLKEHSKVVGEAVSELDSVTAVVRAGLSCSSGDRQIDSGIASISICEGDSHCDSDSDKFVSAREPLSLVDRAIESGKCHFGKEDGRNSKHAEEVLTGSMEKTSNQAPSNTRAIAAEFELPVASALENNGRFDAVNDAAALKINSNLMVRRNSCIRLGNVSTVPSSRPVLKKRNKLPISKSNESMIKILRPVDEDSKSRAVSATDFNPETIFKIDSSKFNSIHPNASANASSTLSLVSRVKDICRRAGWTMEGGSTSRKWRTGCGKVHFYKLDVKAGVVDLMVARGIGRNKREAVRTAFKVMEEKLKKLQIEKVKTEDVHPDNIVNLSEERLESNDSDCISTSIVSTFPPPVFHSRDWMEGAGKYSVKEDLDLDGASVSADDGILWLAVAKKEDEIKTLKIRLIAKDKLIEKEIERKEAIDFKLEKVLAQLDRIHSLCIPSRKQKGLRRQ